MSQKSHHVEITLLSLSVRCYTSENLKRLLKRTAIQKYYLKIRLTVSLTKNGSIDYRATSISRKIARLLWLLRWIVELNYLDEGKL